MKKLWTVFFGLWTAIEAGRLVEIPLSPCALILMPQPHFE
jgi:hypothetical protein